MDFALLSTMQQICSKFSPKKASKKGVVCSYKARLAVAAGVGFGDIVAVPTQIADHICFLTLIKFTGAPIDVDALTILATLLRQNATEIMKQTAFFKNFGNITAQDVTLRFFQGDFTNLSPVQSPSTSPQDGTRLVPSTESPWQDQQVRIRKRKQVGGL